MLCASASADSHTFICSWGPQAELHSGKNGIIAFWVEWHDWTKQPDWHAVYLTKAELDEKVTFNH